MERHVQILLGLNNIVRKHIFALFFRQLLLIEFHIYHVQMLIDRYEEIAHCSRRRNHFAFVRPIKIYIKVSRAQHDSS